MPDTDKCVFISHINEEAALGTAVKSLIEEVFSRDCVRAFLSSDSRDIPVGRKWLDEIGDQLEQCQLVVSLLSPTSLIRPWVNIELGAGWIKGLPVIPLCHSGLRVSELPRPFGDFNGVGLDQGDGAKRLLGGVADALGIAVPSTWLNYQVMLDALRTAATASTGPGAVAPAVSGRPGLDADEVKILRKLAEAVNAGVREMELDGLQRVSQVKPAAFIHYIERLTDLDFVAIDILMNRPHQVRLTAPGSKWLMDHGQMPD